MLDSGEATHGLESTVVDVCEQPVLIYRPGVITLDQIQSVCPGAILFRSNEAPQINPESLPSPGVGIRHYAPRATVQLVEGEGDAQKTAFAAEVASALGAGERVGLMLPEGFPSDPRATAVYSWGLLDK